MCPAAIPIDHDRRWRDDFQEKKKKNTILRSAQTRIKRKHCSHITLIPVRMPGSLRSFVINQLNKDYVH